MKPESSFPNWTFDSHGVGNGTLAFEQKLRSWRALRTRTTWIVFVDSCRIGYVWMILDVLRLLQGRGLWSHLYTEIQGIRRERGAGEVMNDARQDKSHSWHRYANFWGQWMVWLSMLWLLLTPHASADPGVTLDDLRPLWTSRSVRVGSPDPSPSGLYLLFYTWGWGRTHLWMPCRRPVATDQICSLPLWCCTCHLHSYAYPRLVYYYPRSVCVCVCSMQPL